MAEYKMLAVILLEAALMQPIIQLMIDGYTIRDVIETIAYLRVPGYSKIIKFRRHGNEDRFLICRQAVDGFNTLDSEGKSCLEKAGWTEEDAMEFENSWNGYRILRIMKDESITSLLDFGQVLRDEIGPDSVGNVAFWLNAFDREYRTHRIMNKVDAVMISLYEEYPESFSEVTENA